MQMMFSARLMFYSGIVDCSAEDMSDAMSAKDALHEAGYTFELMDEVDTYSTAVFAEITHSSDRDLWNEVMDIIRPFNGDVLEGGIVCDDMIAGELDSYARH
jgi:hypothetical protein